MRVSSFDPQPSEELHVANNQRKKLSERRQHTADEIDLFITEKTERAKEDIEKQREKHVMSEERTDPLISVGKKEKSPDKTE